MTRLPYTTIQVIVGGVWKKTLKHNYQIPHQLGHKVFLKDFLWYETSILNHFNLRSLAVFKQSELAKKAAKSAKTALKSGEAARSLG